MTIYDISEKAGVSIATVSRVLNGSNNVSEKTKKKVEVYRLAEKLGDDIEAAIRQLAERRRNKE